MMDRPLSDCPSIIVKGGMNPRPLPKMLRARPIDPLSKKDFVSHFYVLRTKGKTYARAKSYSRMLRRYQLPIGDLCPSASFGLSVSIIVFFF